MLSTSWLHFVYMTVPLSPNYLSWVYIEVIAEATLSEAALHQCDSGSNLSYRASMCVWGHCSFNKKKKKVLIKCRSDANLEFWINLQQCKSKALHKPPQLPMSF